MAFEYTRYTSFRGEECDTDNYPVVAKVKEWLAVSKQETRKFYVERFNLRKLSELQVRKQYQIKVSNRFSALCILNKPEHKQSLGKQEREYQNIS